MWDLVVSVLEQLTNHMVLLLRLYGVLIENKIRKSKHFMFGINYFVV